MNIWDIVLCLLLAAVLASAVWLCVRRKKNGTCCGGDCTHCSGCIHCTQDCKKKDE